MSSPLFPKHSPSRFSAPPPASTHPLLTSPEMRRDERCVVDLKARHSSRAELPAGSISVSNMDHNHSKSAAWTKPMEI